MKVHLSDLLPQSPDTQIPTHLKYIDVLIVIEFTITHLIQAIKAFYFQQAFHLFDPHVGETSCQIRAYQVLLLAKSIKPEDLLLAGVRLQFLNEIVLRIKKDLIHYQKVAHYRHNLNSAVKTLENFLRESSYNFEFSSLENFLVQSYILTYYKKISTNGNPAIDINRIMQRIKISKTAAKRIIRFYQINLSKISCEFISSLLQETPEANISPTFLQALRCNDDDGRLVLPCYPVIKILWQHMKKNNNIVILNIDRKQDNKTVDSLSFSFQLAMNEIKLIENAPPAEANYIIFGIVKYSQNILENKLDFISRFLKNDIENIILSNMAMHPQYSGNKLRELSDNPFALNNITSRFKEADSLKKEFLFWRCKAGELGCSMQNPALFYIVHIFCGRNRVDIQFNESGDKIPLNATLIIPPNYSNLETNNSQYL